MSVTRPGERWIDAYQRCLAEGRPRDAPFPLDYALPFLAIKRRRPLDEWLREELVVPEGPQVGGLYHAAAMPWIPPVMAAFMATDNKHLWLCAVPRSGKSLLAIGVGLWRACEHGDPVQVISPSMERAAVFYTEKIERCLRGNPRLARQLPDDYAVKSTPRRRVYLAEGGSLRNEYNPAEINSYAARVLIATESSLLDETEGEADIIALAIQRQADYPGKGIQVIESSARRKDCRFAREVAAGTDSRLHAPCPQCGALFEPGTRERIVGWDVETLEEARTFMECPHCRARLTDADRPAMWKGATLVHTNPGAQELSVTVNWFWTGARTLAELGPLEWRLKRRFDVALLRDLCQNYYCLPLADEDERTELDVETFSRAAIHARGLDKYPRGEIPPEVAFTTAGIDVQKDWLYWLCLGFTPDGTVHVLDWSTIDIVEKERRERGRMPRPAEITAALELALVDLDKFHPASVWLDCGFNPTAGRDVHVVEAWGQRRNCRCIRGRASSQISQYKATGEDRLLPPTMRDFMQLRRTGEGRLGWFLNVDRLKDAYRDRIMRPKHSPGCVWFPGGVEKTSLPKHYTGERPVVKKSPHGPFNRWEQATASNRVDLWDCSIYAFAGGLLKLAETTEQAPRRAVRLSELQKNKAAPAKNAVRLSDLQKTKRNR